ncbi:MAG TPA: hypothetical protein VJ597_02410 [Sphingomicrobium sp.]|nr:hypothetical protein [Sphingomicrobium sp.]
MTRKLLIATAILAIGAGAWRAASAIPAGCAAHWKVVLNDESFANNGAGRTFSSAELAEFRSKIEAALKGAVAEGCKSGKVKAALARGIQKVTVTSASGAPQAVLFPFEARTLDFEFPFAEDNLSVPSRKDILDGIACWTSPKSRACALLQED